jgi:hypothetical protein
MCIHKIIPDYLTYATLYYYLWQKSKYNYEINKLENEEKTDKDWVRDW